MKTHTKVGLCVPIEIGKMKDRCKSKSFFAAQSSLSSMYFTRKITIFQDGSVIVVLIVKLALRIKS